MQGLPRGILYSGYSRTLDDDHFQDLQPDRLRGSLLTSISDISLYSPLIFLDLSRKEFQHIALMGYRICLRLSSRQGKFLKSSTKYLTHSGHFYGTKGRRHLRKGRAPFRSLMDVNRIAEMVREAHQFHC